MAALLLMGLFASRVARAQAAPEFSELERADAALVARGLSHLRELQGRPIAAVSVETTGTKWQERPDVRSVSVGEPLTFDVARRALDELLATGRFAQAVADARPFGDGVILRVVVAPRRLVAGIEVQGTLDAQRILSALELETGSEVTEASLRDARRRVERLYDRAGYHDAAVTLEARDTSDPMEVLLEVSVEAGERSVVARRIFVIEPHLDDEVGDLKRAYAVARLDPIDEDALIEADNAMVESLRGARFLDAVVKHRVVRKDGRDFLFVYLETGPRYRFTFHGNFARDNTDLTDALALDQPGVDTSEEAIAEKVRAHYVERGYLDAQVRTERRVVAAGAVLETDVRIDEGRPVRITSRFFPCLPEEAPDGLSADDLGAEIEAVLDEELPSLPIAHAVDEEAVDGLVSPSRGHRAPLHILHPGQTYTRRSYERVVDHIEELLASKGYLNAVVGPVSVLRAECAIGVRGGVCQAVPLPPLPTNGCREDALGLPIADAPLGDAFQCVADPERSITCAPEASVVIPIHLGPQTMLYDAVFEGNEAAQAGQEVVFDSDQLQEIAAFPLGQPFSNTELDAAQARVLRAYQNEGFHYAAVATVVEVSPDRTRARVRFVINEREPVLVEDYEVRGANLTDEALILSRLALCQPLEDCSDDQRRYRRDLVRQSEEQIATLGTFSSVNIALEDEEIPNRRKRVIISVSELSPQYLEPSLGFYTGDGVRAGLEYGHRNIAGSAIALTVRLEVSFLPSFLILDDGVRENYSDFTLSERLERRNTLSVRFPDIGLGPKFELVINGVDARDNQRDFGLSRQGLLPTLNYRPTREITLQLGVSAEINDVTLFGADDVNQAIVLNPNLSNLLRVPDGRTIALAQRIAANWDRRDKPLEATRGTLVNTTVEHVSAFPLDSGTEITSEFLRLSGRIAGYIPLGAPRWALALSLAGGYNLQLTDASQTYPDRRFFLGGVNNVRGFFIDSMVPQDIADQITRGEIDIDDVGVRGGDVYVNPRAELRIPLTGALATGIFVDSGNVWSQPGSIKSFLDIFNLRYTAGFGLRYNTPLGPIVGDVGFKLRRFDFEDLAAFHFSIGLF